MCRGLRKMRDGARVSKAGAKAEAKAMGQAKRERRKSAREDMGVHHGDCPSRELDGRMLKIGVR